MNRATAVSFLSGAVFALGLGISQMTDPNKVLSFLDFFGDWDPSLSLVIGAALAVDFVLFRRILRRERPLLDRRFHMPSVAAVDSRLVIGSALFGLGWGASGFCPGAAVAAAPTGSGTVLLFLAAMGGGMALYRAAAFAVRAEPAPAAAE